MTDTFDVTNPSKPTIDKDPDAILDYSWDWTAWLADVSDTIATKSFIVDVSLTVVSSTVVGGIITAFISGGVAGTKVIATCRMVTVGGRSDDRTIYLKIKDR